MSGPQRVMPRAPDKPKVVPLDARNPVKEIKKL